jgi:hypothetical protein
MATTMMRGLLLGLLLLLLLPRARRHLQGRLEGSGTRPLAMTTRPHHRMMHPPARVAVVPPTGQLMLRAAAC